MMIKRINEIIDELIINGSNINSERDYLIEKSIDIIENNKYEIFVAELNDFVASNICMESGIRNISVGIKIRTHELIINKGNFDFENTVFDIASITKFLTLKLCYELEKIGVDFFLLQCSPQLEEMERFSEAIIQAEYA